MIGASVGTSGHIMLERCPRIILLNVISVNVQNLEFLIVNCIIKFKCSFSIRK
jgi:hypothetical protein